MSARTAITNATITGVEARPEDECFADVDRPLFPKATAEQ